MNPPAEPPVSFGNPHSTSTTTLGTTSSVAGPSFAAGFVTHVKPTIGAIQGSVLESTFLIPITDKKGASLLLGLVAEPHRLYISILVG